MKIPIQSKRLHKNAILPKYAFEDDAGADLFIPTDLVIYPGETLAVGTGWAMCIPPGYELQIRSKSGLTLTYKIKVANSPGTVDSNYTGEVKVLLENNGKEDKVFVVGDKIGQAVLAPILKADYQEVSELPETDRGAGGFGHTGY